MKYILVFVCLILSNNAQAMFVEELFDQTILSNLEKNQPISKHSNNINNYSIGAHHNASWYNDRSGRTASGMRATYGVAHKTLPFGTRVHITNSSNGRSVTAVVTDRGPFVRGRTLDVNQNVAHALGFNGTAHLTMEILR